MGQRRHVTIADFQRELTAVDTNNLEANEIRQIVRRRFQELPALERDAVAALLRISDESCREVAKRYKKWPQTIYNRANSALLQLRSQLGAYQ